MSASDGNGWWRGAEVLVGLSVVALPAALGGALEWTLWLLVSLSAAASGAWLIGAATKLRRWTLHPVLLVMLAPAALAALQLVPLPPSLLAALAPPSAELRGFALVPLGLEAWRPISVDPPATWCALAKGLALSGLLFTALQLGRHPAVRRRLFAVVAATAVVFALVGLGHQALGLDGLFGLWRFRTATPLLTPFGNANHLSAFLALGGTLCVALSLGAPTREALLGWALGAASCGVTVFLSMSRGGIGSFVVTWGLVGALVLATKVGGWRSATPWLLMGATLVGAGLLAFEQLVDRADTVSSVAKLGATKMDAWPMFAEAVRAAWPAGLGRGAFEVGFSRWHSQQLSVTFTHPENFILQWTSEVGVPAAALLLVGAVFALRQVWRAAAGRVTEQVALLGVLGLWLHELFDFSLELNALPVVAAVVLGLVAGLDEARPRHPVRRVALMGALALGLLALVAGAKGLPSHLAAEAQLARVASEAPTPLELRRAALPLIDRHPADYVLYAGVAQAQASRGDARNALAWVNRWLFLRPADARAHRAAAHALLRLGQRSQALLEFRTSFELGDTGDLPLALAVASKEGDFERLWRPRRGLVTEAVGAAAASGLGAESIRALLSSAVAHAPSEEVRLEALELQVRREAEVGAPSRALELLAELPEPMQERGELVVLRARLLASTGSGAQGQALLRTLLAKEPGHVAGALLLVDLLSGSGQSVAARGVLAGLRPFLVDPGSRLATFIREAELWERNERWARAADAWQTASRLAPERADLCYRLAGAYERMGSARAALDAVRRGRLVDRPEGAKAQDAWLERLQALEERQRSQAFNEASL